MTCYPGNERHCGSAHPFQLLLTDPRCCSFPARKQLGPPDRRSRLATQGQGHDVLHVGQAESS
jgi:hypothetical protein